MILASVALLCMLPCSAVHRIPRNCSSREMFRVKNLFGTQDLFIFSWMYLYKSYWQVWPPVVKTRLFLKPPNVDKNRLAAYHTFNGKNCFCIWETHKGVVDLDSFLFFCHYQLTIATNRLLLTAVKSTATFLTTSLQPLAVIMNQWPVL